MIYLRENNGLGDCLLVMSWHSNPLIYQGFYTIRSPLTWDEHYRWWTLTTKDWKKLMVVLVEKDIERTIGIVRVSPLEDFSPQLGFTIGEVSLWGKGYGKQAIQLTLDWLTQNNYKHTHTSVLRSNERALRLLKSLGYQEYGEARKGELWLQRNL